MAYGWENVNRYRYVVRDAREDFHAPCTTHYVKIEQAQ